MTTSTSKTVARLTRNGILALLGLFLASPALALKMTSGFTGSWYDPAHNGQGFLIEVLAPQQAADKSGTKALGPASALVYFYTFNELGERLWLVGLDEIVGTGVEMTLFEGRIEDFDPGEPIDEPNFSEWGTLSLDFSNCSQGIADLTQTSQGGAASKIQIGTGRLNVFRLSTVQAKRCSGGISDDIDPLQPPMVVQEFLSTSDVQGRLRLELGPDGAEYLIDIQDADPGDYEVQADGIPVGNIQIGTGRRGRFQLGGPGSNVAVLDFDPREKQVVLVADTQSLDLGVLDGEPQIPELGGDTPSLNPVSLNQQAAFEVSGMDFSPPVPNFTTSIDANHVVENLRADFRMDVYGPPTGEYDVVVDGRIRGRLVVEDSPIGTFGSVAFSNPDSAGKHHLDFEPRGALIEFAQEDFVLFDFEFPFE